MMLFELYSALAFHKVVATDPKKTVKVSTRTADKGDDKGNAKLILILKDHINL
jgi:hypothetical protein